MSDGRELRGTRGQERKTVPWFHKFVDEAKNSFLPLACAEVVPAKDNIWISRVIPVIVDVDDVFTVLILLSICTDSAADPYEVGTFPVFFRKEPRGSIFQTLKSCGHHKGVWSVVWQWDDGLPISIGGQGRQIKPVLRTCISAGVYLWHTCRCGQANKLVLLCFKRQKYIAQYLLVNTASLASIYSLLGHFQSSGKSMFPFVAAYVHRCPKLKIPP